MGFTPVRRPRAAKWTPECCPCRPCFACGPCRRYYLPPARSPTQMCKDRPALPAVLEGDAAEVPLGKYALALAEREACLVGALPAGADRADLVSEGAVAVLKAKRKWTGSGRFEAVAQVAARRAVRREWHKLWAAESHAPACLDDLAADGMDPEADEDTEWEAMESLFMDQLNDALQTLTDRERRVFRMTYGQKLTDAEVSGAMNISRSRVWQLRQNGLTRVRSDLNERGVNDHD